MTARYDVEWIPIGDLRPYADNPRRNDAAVPRMARMLREFGFRIPILARRDGEIIDGHLRHKAALAEGLDVVPVIRVDGWTEEQIRAFRIAVNQSATWADWDDDLLAQELRRLEAADFDVTLTGFDAGELDALLADADVDAAPAAVAAEEDEPPAPPEDPVTRPGDIWIIGGHRLMCADAANPEAAAALADGEPADMLFTSPPYGDQRHYTSRITDWDALMRGVFSAIQMRPDAQVLVNLGLIRRQGRVHRYWDGWIAWMEDAAGWNLFDWYVWDQGHGLPGDIKGHLHPSHEWIFHFNRAGRRANKTEPCKHAGEIQQTSRGTGMRKKDGTCSGWTQAGMPIADFRVPDSVIRVNRHYGPIGKGISHPAVFPVALPEFLLPIWTDAGGIVWEPFSGSGTTLIAGQKTGRRVRAMEIAPQYVDVALIRFSRIFPDIPITLAATGETFADAARSRKEASHE